MVDFNLNYDIEKKMDTSLSSLADNSANKVDMDVKTKRSRENLSMDETIERCTKKPRQDKNTKLVHLNGGDNDNSIMKMKGIDNMTNAVNMNSNKEIIPEVRNVTECVEVFSMKYKNDIRMDESEEASSNTTATSDCINQHTKSYIKSESSKEPEVVDGLEFSVECANDNDSYEGEKDEEEMKIGRKTIIVEGESEKNEKSKIQTDNTERLKNNGKKNSIFSTSIDSKSVMNSENNDNGKLTKKISHIENNDKSREKNKDKNKIHSKFEKKITYMKKLIRAAGIKVKKYDDLWSNCKTDKQKIDRLKELLEENGILGRPTLGKCKTVKAKREQDREIAELDIKNIIFEGRITRSRKGDTTKNSPMLLSSHLSPLRQQAIHKRIRHVVDSDSE